MAVDWNSKPTHHLQLILDSLQRYKNNARNSREERRVKNNIAAIRKVLKERNK